MHASELSELLPVALAPDVVVAGALPVAIDPGLVVGRALPVTLLPLVLRAAPHVVAPDPDVAAGAASGNRLGGRGRGRRLAGADLDGSVRGRRRRRRAVIVDFH